LSGIGDGTVDEMRSLPDLLLFGLNMFDKQERRKLVEFVSNLNFATIEKMFDEKADKYNSQSPEVALHEGG
jgi:hypothetical protein